MNKSTWLVLKNYVDSVGFQAFLTRSALLQVLQLFVITAVFSKGTIELDLLPKYFHYYIAVIALSSTIGSWESELMDSLGEEYLLRSSGFFPISITSRLLIAGAETFVPIGAMFGLMTYFQVPAVDYGVALLEWITFALMGTAIGFAFGFHHEKAVNNYLNSVAWLLGFGPGPFMGIHCQEWQFLFPGAQSLSGEPMQEILKLFILFILVVAGLKWATLPRTRRFFSR